MGDIMNDFNELILTNNSLALKEILNFNSITIKKNLSLTTKDALQLIQTKNKTLKDLGRIEVGSGTINKLIYEFYDSSYIMDDYVNNLDTLITIFYQYQNEFSNNLTDEQIIKYLRDNYDNYCAGSLELLENYAIENLRQIINNGDYYE